MSQKTAAARLKEAATEALSQDLKTRALARADRHAAAARTTLLVTCGAALVLAGAAHAFVVTRGLQD